MHVKAATRYEHAEAFCLMVYQCQECKVMEVLWNSRDGVTPFGIRCRSCEQGNMLHTSRALDTPLPNFKPWPGMRIFVDATPELIRPKVERFIELYKHEMQYVPTVSELTAAWLERPGTPFVLEVRTHTQIERDVNGTITRGER